MLMAPRSEGGSERPRTTGRIGGVHHESATTPLWLKSSLATLQWLARGGMRRLQGSRSENRWQITESTHENNRHGATFSRFGLNVEKSMAIMMNPCLYCTTVVL